MPNHDALSPELAEEIHAMIARGRTISAIQRLREATGWGLSDAKSWVDRDMIGRGFRRDNAGKPCPRCGNPLRTDNAEQCFACGADWHHAPA